MFDKTLCRVFHKAEITANDIERGVARYVVNATMCAVACFGLVFGCATLANAIKAIILHFGWHTPLPSDISYIVGSNVLIDCCLICAPIVGVVIGCIYAYMMLGEINAECPLKTEEAKQ